MRILLDECVPWPLAKNLTGHECIPVQKCGWTGTQNGELLLLAESRFELFITSDQSLSHQQNLTGRKIAILMLSTNKLRRLLDAVGTIRSAIETMQSGEYRSLIIP